MSEPFQKFNVLIVDDEMYVRELVEDMLLETGIFNFIIHASDGHEAWTKLQNMKFDLVILDINMPKKNGQELIEQLNLHNKLGEQKILISSGHLDSVGVKQAIEQNVKNFVIKPYSEETFVDKVYSLLGVDRKVVV